MLPQNLRLYCLISALTKRPLTTKNKSWSCYVLVMLSRINLVLAHFYRFLQVPAGFSMCVLIFGVHGIRNSNGKAAIWAIIDSASYVELWFQMTIRHGHLPQTAGYNRFLLFSLCLQNKTLSLGFSFSHKSEDIASQDPIRFSKVFYLSI